MNSLRRQLAVGLAAGTALLLLALYLIVTATIRDLAEEQIRTRLEHDAETLLAALDLTGPEPLIAEHGIHPIYRRPFGGHYYVVHADGAELRSRSLWDEVLAEPETPLAHVTGPRAQPLLALSKKYTKGGREVRITVAEELTALEAAIDAFQWRYAAVNLLLLAALLGLQLLVLRRSLRPLDATRDELRRLLAGEMETLGERGPDEILPLIQAFNDALRGLQRRTERSQKAAGNLAHALKAPLAVLGQLREHPGFAGQPELRATLDRELERLDHAVQRELQRARTVGHAAPGQRVDLAEVIRELVAGLDRLYGERHLEIETDLVGPLPVAMDRHDLFELCGNLLDNACKWSRARVRIGAEVAAGQLRLVVEDDGPGVSAQERAELGKRGQRLDERVPGHGLGLAIVGDILTDYGGELRLEGAPQLGGLRAVAILPIQGG